MAPKRLKWRSSSYSDVGADCVEIAIGGRGVQVRDSKDPEGPTLEFTPLEWAAFMARIRKSARYL